MLPTLSFSKAWFPPSFSLSLDTLPRQPSVFGGLRIGTSPTQLPKPNDTQHRNRPNLPASRIFSVFSLLPRLNLLAHLVLGVYEIGESTQLLQLVLVLVSLHHGSVVFADPVESVLRWGRPKCTHPHKEPVTATTTWRRPQRNRLPVVDRAFCLPRGQPGSRFGGHRRWVRNRPAEPAAVVSSLSPMYLKSPSNAASAPLLYRPNFFHVGVLFIAEVSSRPAKVSHALFVSFSLRRRRTTPWWHSHVRTS